MNKLLMVAGLAVLALSQVLLGQEMQTSAKNDQSVTVEGCLTRSAGIYILTGGTSPAQYRITSGDTSAFQGKMNHTFSVTGKLGKSDPQQEVDKPYDAASTTGVGYNTLTAESVKDISPTCSHLGSSKTNK